MTKLTVVAASLVLCAALLAACGDSGSTSSTPTATTPPGRLGSAHPTETCTPDTRAHPVLHRVGHLRAVGIGCPQADAIAVTFFQNKGWVPRHTCTTTQFSGYQTDSCLDPSGRGAQLTWH
jgi:hypothetical protein